MSDPCNGNSRKYTMLHLNNGSCSILSKKYIVLSLYIIMAVATLFLLYRAVWIPDSVLLCPSTKPIVETPPAPACPSFAQNKDSFSWIGNGERVAFDQLLHYIIHPQAPCQSFKVLGGIMGRNKKLDGDKVLCLEPGPGISKECIVYSFGIANEWSFDEAMHKQFRCSIYAFDPSMGMKDHLHSEGIQFYNLGIGEFDEKINTGGKIWNIKSFDSILRQLGHQNKTIDMLKMDIEGAEYVVLEDMLDKGLLNFVNHLCVEIHLPSNPYWNRILNLLKRIESEAGLRLFSTRNNTQVPKRRVPGFFNRYEQFLFEMAWYRH